MKYIIYILISFLVLSCSKKKHYKDKELDKTILKEDFIFYGKGGPVSFHNLANPSRKKDTSKFNSNINKDSLFQVITKKNIFSKVEEFTNKIFQDTITFNNIIIK